MSAECYGRIYYITNKDILPGDELLTYYGHLYAVYLGIDLNLYYEVPKEFQESGLDLNNEDHQRCVGVEVFELSHVKYLPSTWFKELLCLKAVWRSSRQKV